MLGAAGGVAASAREQRETLGAQIAFVDETRHAAYAVAAHLGLRAVGVEHPHRVEPVDERDIQRSVASARLLAAAQLAGEGAQIAGRGGILGREVDHYELVARAVAFYYFSKHLRVNCVSLPKISFKNTNISSAAQIYFRAALFSCYLADEISTPPTRLCRIFVNFTLRIRRASVSRQNLKHTLIL